jgi:hypothetical protein
LCSKDDDIQVYISHLVNCNKTDEDSIPSNLISAYEKVYPGSLEVNAWPDPIWYYFTCEKHYPQKELAAHIHIMEKNSILRGLQAISVINQIDNRLSNKQCIYAHLNMMDYTNMGIGLDEASKIYYNKTVEELSDKECLEIVIMSRNPALYNKIRHPEILEEKVKEYLK